jgi:hypothetical protein
MTLSVYANPQQSLATLVPLAASASCYTYGYACMTLTVTAGTPLAVQVFAKGGSPADFQLLFLMYAK